MNRFDLIYLILAIHLNTAALAENYQNIWAVRIDGDVYKAKDVARSNNFEFIRKASFSVLVYVAFIISHHHHYSWMHLMIFTFFVIKIYQIIIE